MTERAQLFKAHHITWYCIACTMAPCWLHVGMLDSLNKFSAIVWLLVLNSINTVNTWNTTGKADATENARSKLVETC